MENSAWQRGKEMGELKRLLLEYRVLETVQIVLYFSQRNNKSISKIISYLVRTGQLVMDQTGRYAALNKTELEYGLEQKLVASFWVLLQFAGQLDYHMRAAFPAQIFFLADGSEYEIIYAAHGDEKLMNAAYSRKQDDVRYLVIVEQPAQLEILDLPNVQWFCTVGKDGKLQRYIQEE